MSQTGEGTVSSKQVFNIKDLPTKKVILYSTRAHITRDIQNVQLKPGTNEVEIYGLSPTVDEHSIQVEGQGNATITDMSVQLVANREIFTEIYPEESDVSDDESDSELSDSEDEDDTVNLVEKELENLQLDLTKVLEAQNSANARMATWDRYIYATQINESFTPDQVREVLEKYKVDRAKIFEEHEAVTEKLTILKAQIKRKEQEKIRVGKDAKKQKEKLQKQKAKEQKRKELKKAEKNKEANHVKQERVRYWAKKVYKITLLLESSAFATPGSSRRNSIDSVTLASSAQLEAKTKPYDTDSTTQAPVSLVLSYVTNEAGWSPRYDLRISSVEKTAAIVYRAEFLNRTSETWKDAKLSFSTSQTSYQGLDDVVPFMHAWRIKLMHGSGSERDGLMSNEESVKVRSGRPGLETFNRTNVFGLEGGWRPLQMQQQQPPQPPFGSNTKSNIHGPASSSVGNFGGPSLSGPVGGLFGGVSKPQPGSSLFGGVPKPQPGPSLFGGVPKPQPSPSPFGHCGVSSSTSREPLHIEETTWEDNGLTATYDVPGRRTLEPSSLMRRHKIALLNASNIHLSHICVPKLRSAAFLRAKIRNPSSSVTLLKGSAGVTLDGSFLGNMNLPRVSPGTVFDLPLGVDPAIHVNYPKPSVHRSTAGIFSKSSTQVFSRSIWLNNTKKQPIELLVLDQVPVSEEERLKISMMNPYIEKENETVKTGISAAEGSSGAVATAVEGKGSENWGTAVAKLKKDGEVNWTVKLEGAKGCLLKLEYEARRPPGETIVPA